MRVLRAGGAEVDALRVEPLSSRDDVAAALVKDFGVPTYAIKGESNDVYYSHIRSVLKTQQRRDDGRTARTSCPCSTASTRTCCRKSSGGTEEIDHGRSCA